METAYAYLWEFDVPADCVAQFEQHYGPAGTWARLFGASPGYVGTVLLRDTAVPGRYVTVDRWRSEQAFREFKARFASEYAQLDAACGQLTTSERTLGEFSEA